MTKVKINTTLGGHDKGSTINVTPKTAEYLKAQGVIDDGKTNTTTKAADKGDA